MKECLTNPTAGYYTTRAKEKKQMEEKENEEEGKEEENNKPTSSSSPPSPSSTSATSTHLGSGVFGPRGDFITSPDISQLMGDCVGVWLASEWLALMRPTDSSSEEKPSTKKNKSEKVRIVELGPGRGTLLSDALRARRHCPRGACSRKKSK